MSHEIYFIDSFIRFLLINMASLFPCEYPLYHSLVASMLLSDTYSMTEPSVTSLQWFGVSSDASQNAPLQTAEVVTHQCK